MTKASHMQPLAASSSKVPVILPNLTWVPLITNNLIALLIPTPMYVTTTLSATMQKALPRHVKVYEVLIQARLVWKHLSTLRAAERRRARGIRRRPTDTGAAQAAVLDHLDFLDESLAASVTPERSFSRVDAQVMPKVGHNVRRVAAESALKLLCVSVARGHSHVGGDRVKCHHHCCVSERESKRILIVRTASCVDH